MLLLASKWPLIYSFIIILLVIHMCPQAVQIKIKSHREEEREGKELEVGEEEQTQKQQQSKKFNRKARTTTRREEHQDQVLQSKVSVFHIWPPPPPPSSSPPWPFIHSPLQRPIKVFVDVCEAINFAHYHPLSDDVDDHKQCELGSLPAAEWRWSEGFWDKSEEQRTQELS